MKESVAIKLLRMFLVAIFSLSIFVFVRMILSEPLAADIEIYVFIVVAFIIAGEGNIWLDRLLNRRIPWFFSPRRRLVIQFSLSLVWTVIITAVMLGLVYDLMKRRAGGVRVFILTALFGAIFLLVFNTLLIAHNFFHQWQQSQAEYEQLKQQKLESDYQALQNQLNPHFFFNSLHALIAEIRHDTDAAVRFAEQLADIYRYVLQSRHKQTVTLRHELECLRSYIFLHNVRIGAGFNVDIAIDDSLLEHEIPPLALQLLVENALKHNIASTARPLRIDIFSTDGHNITVSNNLQLRSGSHSTGTGLTNLQQRIAHLTGQSIRVQETENEFRVDIPLIKE